MVGRAGLLPLLHEPQGTLALRWREFDRGCRYRNGAWRGGRAGGSVASRCVLRPIGPHLGRVALGEARHGGAGEQLTQRHPLPGLGLERAFKGDAPSESSPNRVSG